MLYMIPTTTLAPSPPPPPPSSSSSYRTYIPPEIYKHPAALLLESSTSTTQVHQILPLIIKNKLYTQHYFQTKLIGLFTKFGNLQDALKVFEPISPKIPPLYHTLLKGFTRYSSLNDSLLFFSRMIQDDVAPVVYSFTYLLKSCAQSFDLFSGRVIHTQIVVFGLDDNVFAMTSLVNLYAKCGMIDDAYKVFDRMPERDLVCWNTVISGFAQNGMPEMALELVVRMQKGEGVDKCFPDDVTLVSVLPACADLGCLGLGKSIHGYAVRHGLMSYGNVGTALIDMYAKCGSVRSGRVLFDRMSSRSVVSWNAMIDGYGRSGDADEALLLFDKLLEEGLTPTKVTIMGALHACADSGNHMRGEFIHKLVDELGLSSDVSVTNSLISMYCKCKRVDAATKLFEGLCMKTLVSWNAIILGCAQSGGVIEALNLFCKMVMQNVSPDSFTLVSVISALAELSMPRQAKWIHGVAIRTCWDTNIFVMTALVDMYSKCGAVHIARKLFNRLDEKHVTTWNAMIDGYGTHGLGEEAVELFEEMRKGHTKPNEVTFLCVISACSHSGYVDKGRHYFSIMKEEYGLEPSMDHFGAMVDLLGRAGQLEEAWNFIQTMNVEPQINVFGAMLGACRIHNNLEFAEKAAKKVFELGPDDGGYHVLLANIYATDAKWDKAASVRNLMDRTGIRKTPGCSLVDLGNEIHTFYSGSTSHPQSRKIYSYLETLIDKIKVAGYTAETNSINDVEADVQEKLLNTHSEKLAIAFGLLNTAPGTTVHIRKNLRVCGDCHNATKFISLVTEREIVVRDMNRFHHFKDGMCSCGDYW
ncbi:hypothetical protein LIER_31699 [Lithospermum erythrorhizon]|uniref:DYW domain-containing protein n=1 Tax=Lithospermum erythrorhizon TaxID=34254 RepID=A0AAV3RX19_LITER